MYAFDYHRPTSVRQAASLAGKVEDASSSPAATRCCRP